MRKASRPINQEHERNADTKARSPTLPTQPVARAASRITWVVLPGCDIITTWDAPFTSVVCAWMRLAMIRSTFVPMALSLPATMYHDGIVFQAGGPEGSPSVESAAGRCGRHHVRLGCREVCGEHMVEDAWLDGGLRSLLAVGRRVTADVQRRRADHAAASEGLEAADGVARIWGVGRDIDERFDAMAEGTYNKQKRNPGLTEIIEIPNRGHALVIDSGWREVADTALAFVRRFV
jgi:hypothetical protein